MLRVQIDGKIDLRSVYIEVLLEIEQYSYSTPRVDVYRDGESREVPSGIFRAMFRLYTDFTRMKDAGRIPSIPASSYTLHWDDLPSDLSTPSPIGVA